MFCGKCGQELENDARFCHACGAVVGAEAAPAVNEPGVSAVAVPAQQKKGPKVLIPIIAGVALVAVVVMMVAGVFASDSARLMKAMTKSGQAYAAAAQKLELPDLNAMAEEQAYSTEMSMWIEQMQDYEELHGLGIRWTADVSVPQRQMGMSIAPYLGAADLLDVRVLLDNDKLYLTGGDLTGGKYYLLNTPTLGQELNNMGMGVSELDAFGFNVFDLAEQMEQFVGDEEAYAKEITAAFTAFAEAVEVEKTGTGIVAVNGSDLKCTGYHVLIPQTAMDTLVDSVEATYTKYNDTVNDAYMDMMRSMGLPEDVVAEMETTMGEADGEYETVFDSIREFVAENGDMELDLYVSGGYLVAAVYADEIDGSQTEIIVNLGGGENYVDDLSLRIIVDGYETRITSTGNHSGADGKFTDKTTVETYYGDGESDTDLVLEMSYEPQAEADNFMLDIESYDLVIEMKGQVDTTNDSFHIRLDELTVVEYGYDTFTLGVEWMMGAYSPDTTSIDDAVALGELTQAELEKEISAIEGYASDWLYGLMESYPELLYMGY